MSALARSLALGAALSLTTGCPARAGAYGASVAMTAAGIALASVDGDRSNPACDDGCLDDRIDAGVNRIGVGLAVLGLALFAVTAVSHAGETPAELPVVAVKDDVPLLPLPEVPNTAPETIQMTLQARRAGLAGRCLSVRSLAKRVRATDPTYYTTVFIAEPIIASCL
jgi:hypothetical protein